MVSGDRKLKALCLAATPFLLFYMVATSVSHAQQGERLPEWWALYTEAQARWDAVTTVMPEYPEEAVRRGITGVMQVKIAKDKQGKVAKIKIQPGVDPLMKKALVNAVKQWVFYPRPDPEGSDRYHLSRLTFRFFIANGEGHVEMYTPLPGEGRLNDADSNKEVGEWNKWEQVWERSDDRQREK